MNKPRDGRLDLKFLDGLRAVAAVTVVIYHAYLFTGRTGEAESNLPSIFRLITLGNLAVPMFIVLSGFVLMLPIAGSEGLRLRYGLNNYLMRRARRILPPYFASLILFGLLILLVPLLSNPQNTAWDSKIPITWGGIVSHIFLFHNLSDEWIYQINGPAWSVATEWQLYFFLPLFILPIWRKVGGVGALITSLLVVTCVMWLFPNTNGAHFWFLALFAMGALAAHALVVGTRIAHLGFIVTVSWVVSGAVIGINGVPVVVEELVLGVAMSGFILWMARRHQEGRPTVFHKLLESRLIVWLGLWSYSLYLVHSPILALGNLALLGVDMSTVQRFGIQVLIMVPISGAVAFAFHRLVERRFMTNHQAKAQKSVQHLHR